MGSAETSPRLRSALQLLPPLLADPRRLPHSPSVVGLLGEQVGGLMISKSLGYKHPRKGSQYD